MKRKDMYLLLFPLLILILLLWLFIKAIATLHTAGELLQLPKQENVYDGIDKDIIHGIQKNLPTGASLISIPGDSDNTKIKKIDFNNDGKDEILYCYKNYGQEDKISVVVLYRSKGSWHKALQLDKALLVLDQIKFADLTGEGKTELLIGWKEANSQLRGLNIYTWNADRLSNIYNTAYSKLIIDKSTDGTIYNDRDKLIIWKENGSFYDEDVIAWNNATIVSVADYYPTKFLDLVKYYKEMESLYSNQSRYWYYRADASMAAHQYFEAEKCINQAFKLNKDRKDRLYYRLIKGNCQVVSGVHNADQYLLKLIDDINKLKDSKERYELFMDAHYYLGEYYDRRKDYTDAYDYYNISANDCEFAYWEDEKALNLKIFKIVMAQTNAGANIYKIKNNSQKG